MGVVAFVLWAPALIPILIAFAHADYDLKGWGDALILSTDLRGWFTPTVFHPLFGGDIVRELHLVQQRALNPELPGFRDLNTVFLGWVSLGLAVVGAVAYRRKLEAWIWTTVLFGLFTLGPLLQINGRTQFDLDGITTTVPLPFALLHYLPVIKANRAPNRNSVRADAGAGGAGRLRRAVAAEQARTVAGRRARRPSLPQKPSFSQKLGFWPLIVDRRRLRWLSSSSSTWRCPTRFPMRASLPSTTRSPPTPTPGSVLQLPLGWRNSFGVFGPEQTLLQYYQTAHGRPMLGGNISRAPDFKMDYFKRIPYFQALTEIEFGRPDHAELLDAAAAQADELAYLYDTEFVVLTPPIADRLPYSDTWQASWDFVKSTWPLEEQPFYAQDGIEAYRVRQPDGSDSFRIDLGEAGTFPYRGEGWDAAETDTPYEASATWATALQSRLFVPLRQVDPAATYDVRVQRPSLCLSRQQPADGRPGGQRCPGRRRRSR